jgi:hypothetical protein
MKFALLSAGKFDALVQNAAQRIKARYPPLIANNPERTVSQERVREVLEDAFTGVLEFEGEIRIGLLRRARLKSALRGELREIGYEERFAEFAAERFIEQLLRKFGDR